MGSFSILMDYAWNCLGNSDGLYLYSDGFLLDSACPVSSWQVEWPNEDLKPLPLSDAAKESMQRRREALM